MPLVLETTENSSSSATCHEFPHIYSNCVAVCIVKKLIFLFKILKIIKYVAIAGWDV